MEPARKLEAVIGHQFSDPGLLEAALTHRSHPGPNNERLELLGDAVLGLVVTEALYRRFPAAAEGQLTRLRAQLVRGDTLARLAEEMELGPLLRLGPGELKSGGRRRASILADAFEAVIGALYLDAGLEAARRFVLQRLGERLAACDPSQVEKDPKTRLQEHLQSRGLSLPQYTVTEVAGEAHAQTFIVQCRVESGTGTLVTTGEGSSRRRAEQAAAEAMLQRLEAA